MLGVAQQGRHGGLDRRGHDQPGVLAHLQQRADHGRVAGDEAGAVAGGVRPLGERMDGEQAVQRAAVDPRVEDGDRLGLPAELAVAFVAGQHGARLAGGRDPGAGLVRVEDAAVRVGRGVDPDQPRLERGDRGRVVAGHRVRPRDPGAHLIGRVGDLGVHHSVCAGQAEQGGQPGDQLLGADHRQHAVVGQAGRPPAGGQVADDRGPQRGRAPGERVARGVRGLPQRLLGELGGRVDRGADREVDQAVRMRGRQCAGVRQRIPGEVRQAAGECHSPWGGRAATIGWSQSIGPWRAAPPGEPTSSKK